MTENYFIPNIYIQIDLVAVRPHAPLLKNRRFFGRLELGIRHCTLPYLEKAGFWVDWNSVIRKWQKGGWVEHSVLPQRVHRSRGRSWLKRVASCTHMRSGSSETELLAPSATHSTKKACFDTLTCLICGLYFHKG